MKSRRDIILDSINDLVADLLWYDRKEDEDLPRGEIEAAIAAGEITSAEMVDRFSEILAEHL